MLAFYLADGIYPVVRERYNQKIGTEGDLFLFTLIKYEPIAEIIYNVAYDMFTAWLLGIIRLYIGQNTDFGINGFFLRRRAFAGLGWRGFGAGLDDHAQASVE